VLGGADAGVTLTGRAQQQQPQLGGDGYQYVLYEKRGHIAYVTLNRPSVMNALHRPAHEELSRIWDDFQHDANAWVAILTGAGERAFCTGNDLKYTAQHTDTRFVPQVPVEGGFGGITLRMDLCKPVICAVNGWAMGGGFEIALACDIIVATETAKFGLPEPKVGLVAGAGGVHRLARQIPLKVAMGMLLTGKHIDAQEAYRLGLVNEVVPPAELMRTAERWAEEMLACAPLAVRGTKEAVMTGLDLPLEAATRRSYSNIQALQASADRVEGPVAFAEKRKPRWTGA
jgi:crotonobetainyl-CoA hydratase